MDDLREKLLKYKELTDSMISSVVEEKEEEFKRLVAEKQLLINLIDKGNYNKVLFMETAKELDLLEQDVKLQKTIEEKKLYIKGEIKHLDEKKNANRAYNNAFRGYSFVNKQI
ncbi:hypothetical protein [Clostridium sp. C8-1-8]|uniref:hypothetical protein n=1 Tax=Clostridium sp. C8-1-8 TaxID=2698831 RepID=UPI001370B6E8|nr:hypothetical protein [Clostridium sp. C8-1-8]